MSYRGFKLGVAVLERSTWYAKPLVNNCRQSICAVDPNSQLHIEVQQVDHPSRVHLDIETNDIAAEVKRLERLGAKVIKLVRHGSADGAKVLCGQ